MKCSIKSEFNFDFSADDTSFWNKSDGWSNGGNFLSGWRSDHIIIGNFELKFLLNNTPCETDAALCSNQSYASAEYTSNQSFAFGNVAAHIKANNTNGSVSSLFTYTNPQPNLINEIDVELLGGDSFNLHINYWINNKEEPTVIPLNFDASESYHKYAIDWKPGTIEWYVDDILIHTKKISTSYLDQKIMMNLWPAKNWPAAGKFDYLQETVTFYKDLKIKEYKCDGTY